MSDVVTVIVNEVDTGSQGPLPDSWLYTPSRDTARKVWSVEFRPDHWITAYEVHRDDVLRLKWGHFPVFPAQDQFGCDVPVSLSLPRAVTRGLAVVVDGRVDAPPAEALSGLPAKTDRRFIDLFLLPSKAGWTKVKF